MAEYIALVTLQKEIKSERESERKTSALTEVSRQELLLHDSNTKKWEKRTD